MNFWLSSLERASIFGMAALAVALIAQWALTSRVPASWRVWIWRVALLQTALVLIPLAPLRLALLPPRSPTQTPSSARPLPPTVAASTTIPMRDGEIINDSPSISVLLPPSTFVANPIAAPHDNANVASTRPRFHWDWRSSLLAAYALGILFHCTWWLRNALRICRVLQDCEPSEDDPLNARLHELATRFGLKRAPRLLQCQHSTPFLVGLVHPAIVLPEIIHRLGAHNLQLEAVLTHELLHLKRRDIAWNMLLWGAQTLFWFHPLAWATKRFHTLEVESACDEAVLQITPIPAKSYGELLLGTVDVRHSPLTAGVGDGFFALKTRLERLHQSPRTPRKVALFAFVSALALTFCALIPLRLVARAQSKKSALLSKDKQSIAGTVRDRNGKPVPGAIVYAFSGYTSTGGYPFEKTTSDRQGHFQFPAEPTKEGEIRVFADAGGQGMGQTSGFFLSRYASLRVLPTDVPIISGVSPTLRFLDPHNRPVANMSVQLAFASPSPEPNVFDGHLIMSRPVHERFNITTNAKGEATFPPLPLGGTAQFSLGDFANGTIQANTKFAQLSSDGSISLNSPHPFKTIHLLDPIKLIGRVTYGPKGSSVRRASIWLWRVAPGSEHNGERDMRFMSGAGTNAQGDYVFKGLRPGRYWLWARDARWDWVNKPFQLNLSQTNNRADLVLTQAPIVQGVVISARTKKPVKGQSVRLYDSQGNSQSKVTNASGQFQFHTLVGKQRLQLEKNPFSPPEGFVLPRRSMFEFMIGAGGKRDFKFELPGPSTTKRVTGTVRDMKNRPLAGVTVYAMKTMASGSEPLETVLSDAQGNFQFLPEVRDRMGISVFVDAGRKGMGDGYAFFNQGLTVRPVQVKVAPFARVKLRLLDSQGRAVPNLTVKLFRVGDSQQYWMAMPRTILARMKATTNAQGEALFPALPLGRLAQFALGDEVSNPDTIGLGDRRGGRFAPLSVEDAVRLNSMFNDKTIHLALPLRLVGHATLSDGRAASGSRVWVRRMTPAEYMKKSRQAWAEGRDQVDLMVAGGNVDAQGRYSIEGIRPGRYSLWIDERQWGQNWAGPTINRTLTTGENRVDFVLTKGAIIEGTVLSQSSHQPVKGQTMGLLDSQGNYRYDITDGRGYFHFRALGGKQHLWIHANGTNSPPAGFVLPAKATFDFSIQEGEKRAFKIALPGAPLIKPIAGSVIGPDGTPVAGARVLYCTAGNGHGNLSLAQCDAKGHFALPAKRSVMPVQLFAEFGELATSNSTVATSRDIIKLQLQKNVWSHLEGRVVDENKQPLSGTTVQFYSVVGNCGYPSQKAVSDANGYVRFEHLRPGTGFSLQSHRVGYSYGYTYGQSVGIGQNQEVTVSMRSATATLSGTVLREDGTPASGYSVFAEGCDDMQKTHKDGKFYCPQVFNGSVAVSVNSPMGEHIWAPFRAHGGDSNFVIRLTKAKQTWPSKTPKSSVSVVGQMAPEIKALRWSDNKARPLSALRGKTVLLMFSPAFMKFTPTAEQNDFARSYKGRIEVLGIQSQRARDFTSLGVNTVEASIHIPFAVDAPAQGAKESTGQTGHLYGDSPYVVIGRDGKVVYVGNKLDRAFTFATMASE